MEQVTVQLAKPKTTPRDFFLWFGAMVALYWSVGSFIALLFRYVDTLFPDPVFYGFDPYSSGIRFAIASLIVVFPLYLLMTRMIQKDLRAHREKQELGIRKWLIYITLFIGGIMLAGDLIFLINSFLGGDLTTQFLLKALAIFVVIGAVFAYYYADLRGRWVAEEGQSRMIGIGAGVVVLIAIVAGFFIMGSPSAQRDMRIDNTRVSDLQAIQSQIAYTYWPAKGALPNTLGDLTDPLMGFEAPTDPETGEPYRYEITGTTSFKLCATFTLPSQGYPESTATRPLYPGEQTWAHGEGEQCFERTIDPELYPVRDDGTYVPKPAPIR